MIAVAAGNVYYQFNCFEAWNKIMEDITKKKVEEFEKSGSTAVKNMLRIKCIEPVKYAIEELDILTTFSAQS